MLNEDGADGWRRRRTRQGRRGFRIRNVCYFLG